MLDGIDVQSRLENNLPEEVKFLAVPITGQIETYVSQKVGEVIRSQKLENLWDTTLTSVHSILVDYIKNEEKDGKLSVNEVYAFASNELNNTPVNFLLNRQLPDNLGNLTLAEITWLDDVRLYINYLDKLPILLFVLSILSFLFAILLSRNKKSVLIVSLILILVIMASTIIALNIGQQATQTEVQPQYSAAASEIYKGITNPLLERTQGYIALSSALLLLIFINSNITFIRKTKTLLAINIDKLLNRFIPSFDYPKWVDWFVINRISIAWTLFTVLFVVLGVRIPPDYQQVINGFITGAVVSLVYMLISQILYTGNLRHK